MNHSKLFMALMGCTPPGRNIEQHDIIFGIGTSIRDLVPLFVRSWPEAKGKIHLDAWRAVTNVDGHRVSVIERQASPTLGAANSVKLFFINLGGYKKDEMEEFHYRMIMVAPDKASAIQRARRTTFYKHTGIKGAPSHIDDKYGIDVDDFYEINDLLEDGTKAAYELSITPISEPGMPQDELHLGYMKINNL